MKVFDLEDLTGTGLVQSLATYYGFASQLCAWYQITIVLNASGTVMRVGDSKVSATRGVPMGGSISVAQFVPVNPSDRLINYDLADVFVIVPAGDIISIAYGI